MRSLLLFACCSVDAVLSVAPARADTVNISGLSALDLGSFSGSGDLSDQDNICVYHAEGAAYSISAYGSGASGAFTLASAVGTVAYRVFFRDSVGSGSFVQLQNPNQSYNFTGASTASSSCADSGGVNATVKITAVESALMSAIAASYSGNLTVVVAPQ